MTPLKKILFICPYPVDEAPSQRFRFEQYIKVLRDKSFQIDFQPFFSVKGWETLYKDGKIICKIVYIFFGFLKRAFILPRIVNYDFVFIHREATPLGPPIFEWIVAKILRKKIIYDFDDAIWLEDINLKSRFQYWIKWHTKVKLICKWSYRISVGNQHLFDYANKYNDRVTINPTTVDTENLHNPDLYTRSSNRKPVIGWTGSHSTLKYIDPVIPVLKELEKTYSFTFLVISNKNPCLSLESFVFRPWTKASEIKDLNEIDIGIMPLTSDPWSEGKCGFKALQYMAMKSPAIVSPVGVNTHIVDHGVTGYICQNLSDWKKYLGELLENDEKRRKMGVTARQKIQKNYSVVSNISNFLSLFKTDRL